MLLHRRENHIVRQCQRTERVDAHRQCDRLFRSSLPAPFDHALAIDFTCEADGGTERVAVELSALSARALVDAILAALAAGEAEHAS